MSDPSPRLRPAIRPPLQALPVARDDRTDPPAGELAGGVAAAKSRCSDLHGLARQMCYATKYGVSL